MVQLPLIGSFRQPESFLVYPDGTLFSTAVQVAPLDAPLMLKTAGEPSEASRGLLVTVPLVQDRLTLTLDELLSLKSLYTVKRSDDVLPVEFTIVQLLPIALF
jgi:hypothetical protein